MLQRIRAMYVKAPRREIVKLGANLGRAQYTTKMAYPHAVISIIT